MDEVTTTYTANGRTETLTDGEDNKNTYVYDAHDRLSRMRYPSPTRGSGASSTTDYEELSYDAAGNITLRRLRDGTNVGYSYDTLNRVTAKDLPGSEPDVGYAYDLLGQMTSAGTSGETIAWTYDALGRPLSQADGVYGTTSQTYDLAGRRTSLTYPVLGFTVGYSHLVTGELSAVLAGSTPTNTFSYDGLGRRTGIARTSGVTTSYGYDAVGRLASLSHDLTGTANDVTFGYSYNPAGQIAGRTVTNDAYSFTGLANGNAADTHNGLNQVSTTGGTSVSHDTRGNTSAIGSASYGYAAENHLASSGSGTFAHDPLGRLVRSSASTTDFARGLDGQVLVERTTGGGAKAYHVAGEGANELLYSYDSAGGSDLLTDERGSVIARTNSAGNLTSINRYDDYGQPQGGSVTGRFAYTGQAWLPELGMYDYHARVYNPDMTRAGGRFMQADPIGYEAGTNLYAYVSGDPVNLVDPSGAACAWVGGHAFQLCGASLDRAVAEMGLAREHTFENKWSSEDGVRTDYGTHYVGSRLISGPLGFGFTDTNWQYIPELRAFGINLTEVTPDSYDHVQRRHGQGVTTRGYFGREFFSLGRSGFVTIMRAGFHRVDVNPWIGYAGPGVGLELTLHFGAYPVGGLGSYARLGLPDSVSNTVILHITADIIPGVYQMDSAYPVRDR